LGEEYSLHPDIDEAPVAVGFRHDVYLREGHPFQIGKPAVPGGAGKTSAHLRERRALHTPDPYAERRALHTPDPYAERRAAQTPNPYASRRPAQTPSPYASRRPAQTPSPYASRRPAQTPSPYASRQPAQTPSPYASRQPAQASNPDVSANGQLWLQPTSFTPYDRYMGTVRTVINHLEPHPANMAQVCRLMEEGRHFEYVMGAPYTANPPGVTAMEQAGDCKAKALWLYNGLGDADALFVIGKTIKHSRTSHAWVYWRNENRWWILDCTNRSQPIAADGVSAERYIPYYSYGRNGEFRHKATRLLINPISPNSGEPVVADHSTEPGGR